MQEGMPARHLGLPTGGTEADLRAHLSKATDRMARLAVDEGGGYQDHMVSGLSTRIYPEPKLPTEGLVGIRPYAPCHGL